MGCTGYGTLQDEAAPSPADTEIAGEMETVPFLILLTFTASAKALDSFTFTGLTELAMLYVSRLQRQRARVRICNIFGGICLLPNACRACFRILITRLLVMRQQQCRGPGAARCCRLHDLHSVVQDSRIEMTCWSGPRSHVIDTQAKAPGVPVRRRSRYRLSLRCSVEACWSLCWCTYLPAAYHLCRHSDFYHFPLHQREGISHYCLKVPVSFALYLPLF